MLVERLHVAAVVVGENFRFGHRAAGDLALLNTLGHRFGFEAYGVPLVVAAGEMELSSTYVRACVAAGDVAGAAAALGRPHRVEGVVVRGDRRGRDARLPDRERGDRSRTPPCRRTASTPAGSAAGRSSCRRRSRSGRTRPSRAGTGGSRRTWSASTGISTASTSASTSSPGCVGMLRFEGPDAVERLREQMARDVVATAAVLAGGPGHTGGG